MLILSCSSKLQLLEGVLRQSLPETLPVLGAVMNISRGNPAGHEVLVDSWPNFKAVLTRPRKEVVTDDSDFYANMYSAFYRDLGAYRALLSSPGAINWAQTFRIHGLQDSVCEASRDIAKAKGFQVYPSTYLVYLLPSSSTVPDVRFGHRVTLSMAVWHWTTTACRDCCSSMASSAGLSCAVSSSTARCQASFLPGFFQTFSWMPFLDSLLGLVPACTPSHSPWTGAEGCQHGWARPGLT
ncbi:glycine N-acyltransferase-like protein 3 isoform X4 [Alligator mississippiensis]|uniref:glycine N-acyltransferase-like protein 3 isoform X4 n=1 Tax=Alligator mississippiensis TaxID=8496 RepID=UPI0009071138|nr:glycine N-acyltransferase-like protein 3 isoform X4 [Alligator mississippiensis]